MIKLIYDFNLEDIFSCKYLRSGYPDSLIDLKWKTDLLTTYDSPIISLQFLGGGSDSVTFINNENNAFYTIEPANGLIVAHELISGFLIFENRRLRSPDFRFIEYANVVLSETIFRHHRNDDEIFVICEIFNESKVEDIKLKFSYPNVSYIFECKYLDFVPELFLFA